MPAKFSLPGNDGDDEDAVARRRERASVEVEEDASSGRGRRTHSQSVFDPPPSKFEWFRAKMYKYFDIFWVYWKKVRNDPYQWSLFKSILWFTVGLKLFNDLARHAKISAVFGGYGPSSEAEPPKGKLSPCPRKVGSEPQCKSPTCTACLQSDKLRQDPVPCTPKVDALAPPKKGPCPPPKVNPCALPKKDPCSPPKVDPSASLKVGPCAPPKVDPCAPPSVGPNQPRVEDPCPPPEIAGTECEDAFEYCG